MKSLPAVLSEVLKLDLRARGIDHSEDIHRNDCLWYYINNSSHMPRNKSKTVDGKNNID